MREWLRKVGVSLTNQSKKLQLYYILSIAYPFMKSFKHKASYYALITWFLFACIWYVTTVHAALDLFFDLPLSLQWGTFPVAFVWWGNNYAGALVFNNQTAVNQTVTFTWWITVTCKRQIHGYYFNAARGVGLLPLSSATEMNDGVTVQGGIYTSCGQGDRLYDIVGLLWYEKDGLSLGTWVFGVDTDIVTNSSNGLYQSWAISWKISNGLDGRFFDTMFGIGTVAISGNNEWGIGTLSNLIGTFTNIYVQWRVSLWQSVEESERAILAVNLAWTKTLLTSNDELNFSNVLNTVARNTEKRCRSTNTYTQSDVAAGDIGTNKFICIQLDWNDRFVIEEADLPLYVNKDIVFLDGNVLLSPDIYDSTNTFNYLSFYLANWDLMFGTYEVETWSLTEIDNNGFIKTTSATGVTEAIYIVGNFIVNGLVRWDNQYAIESTIPFKTIIHGKLVSLNTFTTASDKRILQLQSTLSNRPRSPSIATLLITPNTYFPNGQWTPSIGDVFSWKCADISTWWQIQWYWSNPIGSFDAVTVETIRASACPPGHRYPLMLIEKLLPTSFFTK